MTEQTNAAEATRHDGSRTSSEGLGPTRGLTRAAFERWYSDGGKWPQSVERNSSGEGYKYVGAASAWTAWKAAAAADLSLRVELLAVLARLCELNAAERPMARVWGAAQALVDSHKAPAEQEARQLTGADARKPCTCDGAGRGPGRECVVKAGGRLGDLWRCAAGLGA